jgi:hypothetical protein
MGQVIGEDQIQAIYEQLSLRGVRRIDVLISDLPPLPLTPDPDGPVTLTSFTPLEFTTFLREVEVEGWENPTEIEQLASRLDARLRGIEQQLTYLMEGGSDLGNAKAESLVTELRRDVAWVAKEQSIVQTKLDEIATKLDPPPPHNCGTIYVSSASGLADVVRSLREDKS